MSKAKAAGIIANVNARSQPPVTSDCSPAAIRAAGGPRQALSQLAERLERRATVFERAHDPRCVFARAYARLNRRLADAVLNAGFHDPEWVALLSLRFAEYYLEALRDRAAGNLTHGAWASVFEASEHRKTSLREELVLGMTTHVVHDLALALCDVGMTSPGGGSHIRDFNELNEVLGPAIEDIQLELVHRYDPWLGALDHLLESYDDILTNQGLRLARAAAWYNAERLLDPASQKAARAAMERAPEITVYELMHPPVASLRAVLRMGRKLSKLTRRWPPARRLVSL
jgi:hypothetical protein